MLSFHYIMSSQAANDKADYPFDPLRDIVDASDRTRQIKETLVYNEYTNAPAAAQIYPERFSVGYRLVWQAGKFKCC